MAEVLGELPEGASFAEGHEPKIPRSGRAVSKSALFPRMAVTVSTTRTLATGSPTHRDHFSIWREVSNSTGLLPRRPHAGLRPHRATAECRAVLLNFCLTAE